MIDHQRLIDLLPYLDSVVQHPSIDANSSDVRSKLIVFGHRALSISQNIEPTISTAPSSLLVGTFQDILPTTKVKLEPLDTSHVISDNIVICISDDDDDQSVQLTSQAIKRLSTSEAESTPSKMPTRDNIPEEIERTLPAILDFENDNFMDFSEEQSEQDVELASQNSLGSSTPLSPNYNYIADSASITNSESVPSLITKVSPACTSTISHKNSTVQNASTDSSIVSTKNVTSNASPSSTLSAKQILTKQSLAVNSEGSNPPKSKKKVNKSLGRFFSAEL